LEEIFECKIKPHILPNMLGQTNFAPKKLLLACRWLAHWFSSAGLCVDGKWP